MPWPSCCPGWHIGIHATFNGGTLVVTGLTATVILTGAWHWGVQFCYTHGWFKATSQSGKCSNAENGYDAGYADAPEGAGGAGATAKA